MVRSGHSRTAVECRMKSKTLRQEFKRVQEHNRRSGNSRKECAYYSELERIFAGDPSIQPSNLSRSLDLRFCTDEELERLRLPVLVRDTQDEPPRSGETQGSFNDGSQDFDQTQITTIPETELELNDNENVCPNSRDAQETRQPRQDSTALNHPLHLTEMDPSSKRTPAERLEIARRRKRRVAAITDVGRAMMRVCKREVEAARQRHDEMMHAEERHYRGWLSETQRNRESIAAAMSECSRAMFAAVEVLRGMADERTQTMTVSTTRNQATTACLFLQNMNLNPLLLLGTVQALLPPPGNFPPLLFPPPVLREDHWVLEAWLV
ncbi:uncharacterized protein LOC143833781 [Paroedura picta]|uniref:uncharacterized protein LOC143833781 n=1 Tax=Paroedura picta TaxID=143630 RepID=UPI004056C1A0